MPPSGGTVTIGGSSKLQGKFINVHIKLMSDFRESSLTVMIQARELLNVRSQETNGLHLRGHDKGS